MKKIRYYLLIAGLFASANLFAQNKELVNVVVGNEGNFLASNATITNYLLETTTATNGVFLSANGVSIGDVVQSLAWIDGKIFAVVNNSQKIVVVNPLDFTQTGQITFGEGASPREIVQVTDSKAYVTDLYGSAVHSVNLNDLSVTTDTISVGINPDRIIEHNGYAYVGNNGFGSDSTIFKVDVSTNAVVDTFYVSRGPAGMVVDSQDNLWVVCTGYAGDYDTEWNLIPGTARNGGIHGINLQNGIEIAFEELASADSDIALDEQNGALYVNSGGVRVFNLANNEMAADTLIPGFFYAMGYESVGGSIYLANAKDFSSTGEILMYSNSGEEKGSFDAGIIPGSFLFVYDDMISTSNESEEKIQLFALAQNYPNPFNPTTNIEFSLQQPGNIILQVYSSNGQKVAELANGYYTTGSHSVTFDASKYASGIYIYRIVTEQGSISRKMMLIK